MKTSTDTLFVLLKEFDDDTLKSFTTFLSAFNKGKSLKQILLLTNTYHQQERFNERQIKKLFGNNYSEIKSKTYYSLLDYLRIIYKDKNFLDIHRLLDFAVIMQDKTNWVEAVRFYDMAEKWTNLNQAQIYQLLLVAHKGWSTYKTDKENASKNALLVAQENEKLADRYYTSALVYSKYVAIGIIALKTFLLRSSEDYLSVNKLLNEINALDTSNLNNIDQQNISMATNWCLQLLTQHEQAYVLEKNVFEAYHQLYENERVSYKPLMLSFFMNFLSVCATSRNKNSYYNTLHSFKSIFRNDFENNKLVCLIYNIHFIQKLTFFNDSSIRLSDIVETEKIYQAIKKTEVDIAVLKSAESALYECFTLFKQFNKAKKYCEAFMKQKITIQFRKDLVEIANLYYLVILFEESIYLQEKQKNYVFENNLLYIHAQQYYERIRKSKDNYSFDLLFLNFFRKLPKKIKAQELQKLFSKLLEHTIKLKSKPENIYIQNLFLLLDFEKWIYEKINFFSEN